MADLLLKLIEKVFKDAPVHVLSFLLIACSLGFYWWDARGMGNKYIYGPLATAAVYLLLKFLKDRRPKPVEKIQWNNIEALRENTELMKEVEKGDHVRLSDDSIIHWIFEVTQAVEGGFLSVARLDSTHSEEPLDYKVYITEVAPTVVDDKWWEGTVIRVGYYETQGTHFEWFTANLKQFLEMHKKQYKKYLKRRPKQL